MVFVYPSVAINTHILVHPGELELIESCDRELEDLSVLCHVARLGFADDILTSDV